MNYNDKEFLTEVDAVFETIMEIAEKYGVKEKLVVACSVSLVNDKEDSDDEVVYSTITNMLVDSEEELTSMLGHMLEIYKNQNGYSFDDLFDNITLN